MTGRATRGSRRRRTRTDRAGLRFSVARAHRHLRSGRYADRVGVGAAVYLAAVVEYLAVEVLGIAGDAARDDGRSRISPRHIQRAVYIDPELSRLLSDVTISNGRIGTSV
ncbi:unnamed protein product [Darwinula stevensoni]|uniref:Histone H2A n=1 Tax=Darwinula stevensoni TaxID=69355 RepID=A0A7R8XC70_9CRUS|nr:unnamed protein product [Darwinula stevensoni]CAG0893039.1 unnamed protein product [Darwinula stevensoni]